MRNIKNNFIDITDFTCNGKCSCCGECCGNILHLSKKEIKRIDNYLKEHNVKPTRTNNLIFYDNTCPFRDNEKKICKIYEVRPDICKAFVCNKTPREAMESRELINCGKMARSMRNLFFPKEFDNTKNIVEETGIIVFDRNGKILK